MTLRELVQKAGGINSPQMDYNLNIYDIDLNKNMDIDPRVYIDKENEQLTLKVDG